MKPHITRRMGCWVCYMTDPPRRRSAMHALYPIGYSRHSPADAYHNFWWWCREAGFALRGVA